MATITVATDAGESVEVIYVTLDDVERLDRYADLLDRIRWAVREAVRQEAR